MERHIGLLLVVLGVSTSAEGTGWFTSPLDMLASVKVSLGSLKQDVVSNADLLHQTVTESISKVTGHVSGQLSDLANKVGPTKLTQFANNKMLPAMNKLFPTTVCVRGAHVKVKKSVLLLTKSILRMRNDYTASARIVNYNNEDSMDVEIYLEFRKSRLQYSFRFGKDLVVYNLNKGGKLLVTQRGNMRVSIFGKTVQSLTEFDQKVANPQYCVVMVDNINATITGHLEHTKIKYYSFGIGATQRYISGVLRVLEKEIQENLGRTLSYLIEKEVRRSKLFCGPKYNLEELVCDEEVMRTVA